MEWADPKSISEMPNIYPEKNICEIKHIFDQK